MKRILIITPEDKSSNAFWRSVGPMNALQKLYANEVTCDHYAYDNPTMDLSWARISKYDVIFLHRPVADDHIKVMQIAWASNVPVWVDYDDWLFNLPAWNPNNIYSSMGAQMNISRAIACADVVSCTTTPLYDAFRQLNPETVILPNAYRSDLYPFREEQDLPKRNENQFLFWRGSNTHAGDLLSVKSALKETIYPVWFMGGPEWQTVTEMPENKRKLIGSTDTTVYFRTIYDLAPKAFISPLVDCHFNRCKSNIAWMEALFAGALCIAPDMPEWNRDGCVNYKAGDSKSFSDACREVMEMDPKVHEKRVQDAFYKMKETFDVKAISHQRRELIRTLTSSTYRKQTQNNPFDHQGVPMKAMAKVQEIRKQHAQPAAQSN